ncbi:MAG: hypothetical protein ICV70_05175 [Jiangellaceae bacterium]|nr:hypothetical protein [Jiangellaceae bacterium]
MLVEPSEVGVVREPLCLDVPFATVESPRFSRVRPVPLDEQRPEHQQSWDLSRSPGELPGEYLVVERIGKPWDLRRELTVVVACDQSSGLHQRDAEERVDRHRCELHAEPRGIWRPLGQRVDADDDLVEHVTGEDEMRAQQPVHRMVSHGVLEEPGEVRRKRPGDEDRQCDQGVRQHSQRPALHRSRQPLPRPALACRRRPQCPQRQRDRPAQDEQHRTDQHQHDVLHHVHGEQRHAVRHEPGQLHRGDRPDTEQPRDDSARRPAITAAAQPPHSAEVEQGRAEASQREHRVREGLGDESQWRGVWRDRKTEQIAYD